MNPGSVGLRLLGKPAFGCPGNPGAPNADRSVPMSMPGNANLTVTGGALAALPSHPNGRSALLAIALSVLVPGLGHVYVGRALRGLVLFAIVLAAETVTLIKVAGAAPRFWPIAAGATIWFAMMLFTAIEAAVFAHKAKSYALRSYNRWYAYAGAFAAAAAIHIVLCAAVTQDRVRSFIITASSMEPTILLGERLFAGMSHYRTNAPARGDVAIYRHPKFKGDVWVKRIVALPGDRIMMRNGDVIVNGAPVEEPYVRVGDRASMSANTSEVVVPAGHVFVLGDNRANSTDSRASSHGFVPVANLIGRATDIAWSGDLSRLGHWIGTPR